MTDLTQSFASLFRVNMGVKPGERIVVFSDTIRPDEHPDPADAVRRQRLLETAESLASFADGAYGNTCFVSFPATTGSGVEPPEPLWRAIMGERIVDRLMAGGLLERLLAKSAVDQDLASVREIVQAASDDVVPVVVAMANNSTSHTRFRHLVNVAGGRFASLPHFDPTMFLTSMAVDWQALSDRTALLASTFSGAVTARLTAPNGTHLTLGIAGRTAKGDDGILTAPGSFGNLPAGEVFLAPVEGTAAGELVVEYAPTRQLASPLLLTVAGGEVTAVHGEDPYREELERRFAQSRLNRNIAELGIGTNDQASRPDNLLEAEKILGTVHIALGDNSGFGGKVQTPFHEDYVIFLPTLELLFADGEERTVIVDGRLLS